MRWRVPLNRMPVLHFLVPFYSLHCIFNQHKILKCILLIFNVVTSMLQIPMLLDGMSKLRLSERRDKGQFTAARSIYIYSLLPWGEINQGKVFERSIDFSHRLPQLEIGHNSRGKNKVIYSGPHRIFSQTWTLEIKVVTS